MNNILLITQRILQHKLSRIVGWFGECRWVWLKNKLIGNFIRRYHVDMSLFIKENSKDYANLNEFFLRKFRPNARLLMSKPNEVLSPVEGRISQMGIIQGETLVQAKQKVYTLSDLLAGDQATADLFKNGYFMTLYLAPSDYHWVHMPIAGNLQQMIYVPGYLFSVNSVNTQKVSQLFTRNERVISLFKTKIGCMAMIQVGACLVGNIGTVWEGIITPKKNRTTIQHWDYQNQNYWLEQAAEMGYFKLGSTVILLFTNNQINWDKTLSIGKHVQCGQSIGEITISSVIQTASIPENTILKPKNYPLELP